jgi:hypothetical protein
MGKGLLNFTDDRTLQLIAIYANYPQIIAGLSNSLYHFGLLCQGDSCPVARSVMQVQLARLLVKDIAFHKAHSMTLVNNFTYSTQFRLPNRLEKIDLQFQSCESFAFLKCGSVGDAHGCIGYVTKDTP